MDDSRQNTRSEVSCCPYLQEKPGVPEDEIDLLDCFSVLLKHKKLVFAGVIVSAFLAFSVSSWQPTNYQITYLYDVDGYRLLEAQDPATSQVKDDVLSRVGRWDLDYKNYYILLEKLYGPENADRLIKEFQKEGLSKYASDLTKTSGASEASGFSRLVKFETIPSYNELKKAKIAGRGASGWANRFSASLLQMTVTADSEQDLKKISTVVRDNFEGVISLHLVAEQLKQTLRVCRSKAADIEKDRFGLQLELRTNRSALEKLRRLETARRARDDGEEGSAFDYEESLGEQIQAAELKEIELERQIALNKANYERLVELMSLNEELTSQLESKRAGHYTIGQFCKFLRDMLSKCENEGLKGSLGCYIKQIENRISASVPITLEPNIERASGGYAKVAGVTFVLSLMVFMFVSFLAEAFAKRSHRSHKV